MHPINNVYLRIKCGLFENYRKNTEKLLNDCGIKTNDKTFENCQKEDLMLAFEGKYISIKKYADFWLFL